MTQILQKLGMPAPASAHAPAIDDFLGYVHVLMLILFVGWLAYYFLALFRFRKAASPKADYTGVKSNMSTYLEIGVAIVEAVLLVGFAVPLWARAVEDFPVAKGDPKTDPIEVQIMGQQYKWSAHYAGPDAKWGKQDIKSASATNPFGLVEGDADGKDDVVCALGEPFKVPTGRAVICKISSMDVIHSFKIPSMRVTQDAIPGLSIPVHFKPTVAGTYEIYCAQLCGNLHSGMKGTFKVVPQAEYDTWYAAKSKAGGGGGFE